jgi:hypothetical protein
MKNHFYLFLLSSITFYTQKKNIFYADFQELPSIEQVCIIAFMKKTLMEQYTSTYFLDNLYSKVISNLKRRIINGTSEE